MNEFFVRSGQYYKNIRDRKREKKTQLPVSSQGNQSGSGKELVSSSSSSVKERNALALYIKEISRYRLLTLEEEQEMVRELHETGDIEIAKELVQANLRLVVKIALEYRKAYSNIMDLIQEGNIGLMKAVSKYDPEKGAKLSYYASWWIRSYILKFILDNFRLVKIGTTSEQKKLFYQLIREKDRLHKLGQEVEVKKLSDNLGVSEKAVQVMDQRMDSGAEVALETPIGDGDGGHTLGDILNTDEEGMEEILGRSQEIDILKDRLGTFVDELKERDRIIFKKRLLDEVPSSLQSIADDYGVSRERIRQIEERLIKKLKVYMSEFIR